MTQVFEYYNAVFSSLKELETQLLSAYQQLNSAKTEYSNAVSLANQNQQYALETIEKNAAKVNAFISIARTHTTQLNEGVEPQAFDSGVLSRLSVQINTGIANDPFAAQLYTAATGQMVYLRQQKEAAMRDHTRKLAELKETLSTTEEQAKSSINQLEAAVKQYLYSTEFTAFISELHNDHALFAGQETYSLLPSFKSGTVSVGSLEKLFPIPTGLEATLVDATKGLGDVSKKKISMPANISINHGAVLIAEYENSSELEVLNGVQNIILNIARHYGQDFEQITYIDPIRFNASSLGCLSRLVGHQNSLIDPVPTSMYYRPFFASYNICASIHGSLFLRIRSVIKSHI